MQQLNITAQDLRATNEATRHVEDQTTIEITRINGQIQLVWGRPPEGALVEDGRVVEAE